MNYEINCKNYGTRKAEVYIGCFERMFTILFKNITDVDVQIIEDNMEKNYYKWSEDFEGMCCEEFILEKLPRRYKNKIIALVYDKGEEE